MWLSILYTNLTLYEISFCSFPTPYTAFLSRDEIVLISLDKLKAIVTAKVSDVQW